MITSLVWSRKLQLFFRLVLGITFIYASIHKIIYPGKFAQIIYGYGLFPGELINIAAILLPFLELFSGLFLVIGIYKDSAALIINIMLTVFIAAISINLIRGHEFDCGCFSVGITGYELSSVHLLLRDIIFLLMGVHLFITSSKGNHD
ncbi:MAG: DoxX family membrane protein [Deltaproteobacteria bacterium]|nr:DoxX family membrane protein [Deltaproteobacteria bacterium]